MAWTAWTGCVFFELGHFNTKTVCEVEKSPFLMGKLTISMAIFNSKLLVYQRVIRESSQIIYFYGPCELNVKQLGWVSIFSHHVPHGYFWVNHGLNIDVSFFLMSNWMNKFWDERHF